MDFLDRLLLCSDCGEHFVFTAGEQLFFFDKQFRNDPKRCKPCKGKRMNVASRPAGAVMASSTTRTETRTDCSACGIQTTVPFKPTQGRPVLCRQCFQARAKAPLAAASMNVPATALEIEIAIAIPMPGPASESPAGTSARQRAAEQMNAATSELVAAAAGSELTAAPALELAQVPAPL